MDWLPSSTRVAVGGIRLRTACFLGASGRPPSKHRPHRGRKGRAALERAAERVTTRWSSPSWFSCSGSRGKIAGRRPTETSAGKTRSARVITCCVRVRRPRSIGVSSSIMSVASAQGGTVPVRRVQGAQASAPAPRRPPCAMELSRSPACLRAERVATSRPARRRPAKKKRCNF